MTRSAPLFVQNAQSVAFIPRKHHIIACPCKQHFQHSPVCGNLINDEKAFNHSRAITKFNALSSLNAKNVNKPLFVVNF